MYLVTNNKNGKSYVGMTKGTIEDRVVKGHFRNPNAATAIGRAVIKHGAESFSYRSLEIDDNAPLGLWERFYKHLYEADDPRFGYNSTGRRKAPLTGEKLKRFKHNVGIAVRRANADKHRYASARHSLTP